MNGEKKEGRSRWRELARHEGQEEVVSGRKNLGKEIKTM